MTEKDFRRILRIQRDKLELILKRTMNPDKIHEMTYKIELINLLLIAHGAPENRIIELKHKF